jgi:hypothetical protein
MEQFLATTATGPSVLQLEGLLRAALFRQGAELVGYLLQAAADQIDANYQPSPGDTFKGRVALQCHGLFGHFRLVRNYYYHPVRGGSYPADAALGLDTGHTPALVRLANLEGADETSFLKAERHLLETGGIQLEARQVERLVQRVGPLAQVWQQREYKPGQEAKTPVPIMYVSVDGTGVPMRKEEVAGRAGKQADGKAKTRQAYLGCVFTQHGTDEKGRPVRDWASTTYLSSLESSAAFGPMLRGEALRRGLASAGHVVLLIDGAPGLEHLGRDSFKDATQIVDFYHATEHASRVLVALLGSPEHPDYQRQRSAWTKRLLKNGVQKLIADTRAECAGKACAAAVEKELHYFVENVPRMQYGTFRRHGYFIGSGVIEAGCKTVIGSRCKQSGMFWGVPGVEHILALRCINASQRDADFWKYRLAQLAHRKVAAPRAA